MPPHVLALFFKLRALIDQRKWSQAHAIADALDLAWKDLALTDVATTEAATLA